MIDKNRNRLPLQLPLVVQAGEKKEVLFRKLVSEIPSTTYATFGLYRHPAKFIPQVIAYILKNYSCPGMSVFDPFAGYGTTGVVARMYGCDYEMWDINPLLQHLHDVATMDYPPEVEMACLLSQMATFPKEFIPNWSNVAYWFPEEFLPFLFKVWGFYHSLKDEQVKTVLLIPLLKATRFLSYNDAQRQKLCKSRKSEDRIKALRAQDWQNLFFRMVADGVNFVSKKLEEYRKLGPKVVKAVVKGGVDTLTLELEQERDILITSPPYLQAQEYIRATKMDLFWLGYREAFVKELSRNEIPYRAVDPCPVYSETYHRWQTQVQEPHLRRIFGQYFGGVLGALSRLQTKVSSRLFLFVGSAGLRGRPVPIDDIFVEHFTALGWTHEVTLKDTIVSRTMFSYSANPATGLPDERMRSEHLVVLLR